ncbi:MAG: quinolinate synthase NadA, partial [Clostridiaceae bacterium]
DRNLGSYVQEKVPEKKIILWNGCCNVHDVIDAEEIQDAKERYGQDIKVLVHPECKKEVRDLADFIGSTGEIIKFASSDKSLKYLIVTEVGILHELKKNNPNKEFYTLDMVCKSMKITTMENIYNCLKDLNNEIQLDEDMRKSAHKALENMHILGG